jgi:hypothetical protein
MRQQFRFALVACGGLLALACAGQALGAYGPKTQIKVLPKGMTVSYQQGADDDATARLAFFAPPGVQTDLTKPVGTTIGSASAVGALLSAGGAQVTLAGPVLVGDGTNATVKAQSTACTGVATHAAVWILAVTTQDQPPLNVPVFVDPVTTGSATAFASLSIVTCFRSPYIPPAQGGQPLGFKPLSASLTLNGVFTPPSGTELPWTGLFIPWAVGTGTVNPLAAAESQALMDYPVRFRLTGKDVVSKHSVGHGRHRHSVESHKALIAGLLTAGGEGQAGASYTLVAGGRKWSGKTNANGRFTKRIPITKTTTFRATASLDPQDVTGDCNPLIPISLMPLIEPTCTGLTHAGLEATSNALIVKKKKKKH